MSRSNYCLLTCIQISQEAGKVVWYYHLLKNFPQLWSIVKGFGIVNKAEIDVFLELSCFFDDPADVGPLISGSYAFSKTSLNIWKFTVHILLKPGLENFEHYFASVWDECNCVVVWTFFGIHCLSLGLEWKLTFSSTVATVEFSKFAGILDVALPQYHQFYQIPWFHIHDFPISHPPAWALCVCSDMSDSLQPHGLAPQAPLSMGFSRQEYWGGLPFPSPGHLPNPGIEPASPASPTLLYLSATWGSPSHPTAVRSITHWGSMDA